MVPQQLCTTSSILYDVLRIPILTIYYELSVYTMKGTSTQLARTKMFMECKDLCGVLQITDGVLGYPCVSHKFTPKIFEICLIS
jgi:hypothetical protein